MQSLEFDVEIKLARIGISLTSNSQELLYGCFWNVEGVWKTSSSKYVIRLSTSETHWENCLPESQYRAVVSAPVKQSIFGIVHKGRQ